MSEKNKAHVLPDLVPNLKNYYDLMWERIVSMPPDSTYTHTHTHTHTELAIKHFYILVLQTDYFNTKRYVWRGKLWKVLKWNKKLLSVFKGKLLEHILQGYLILRGFAFVSFSSSYLKSCKL